MVEKVGIMVLFDGSKDGLLVPNTVASCATQTHPGAIHHRDGNCNFISRVADDVDHSILHDLCYYRLLVMQPGLYLADKVAEVIMECELAAGSPGIIRPAATEWR